MNAQFGSLSAVETSEFSRWAGFVAGSGKQSRRRTIYGLLAVADIVAIAMGFALASLLHFDKPIGWQSTRLTILVIPIFLTLAVSGGAYGINALLDCARGAMRAIVAFAAAMALILFVLDQLDLLHVFNGWLLALSIGVSVPAIVAARSIMDRVARKMLGDQPLSELVILDGSSSHQNNRGIVLHANDVGIAADISDPHMLDRVGTLLKHVDRVSIACSPERQHDWTLILKGAAIDGEVFSGERPVAEPLLRAIDPGDMPAAAPPTHLDFVAKRVLDLVMVGAALMLLAPLLIFVAIAIKLDSPGPVFFVQQRVGRRNRLFRMYKFRSMRTEACDSDGHMSARRDDDRITRVGRFLRATSIDELPQLLNVLMGSMSIVGPRPHALGSTASEKLFWDIDRRYWLRHTYPPGLTGLAQVRGYRGATPHARDLENRLASDLEYVRNWSPWLDIKIILKTFGVLVHPNAF